jgi:hypothetical protein
MHGTEAVPWQTGTTSCRLNLRFRFDEASDYRLTLGYDDYAVERGLKIPSTLTTISFV